MKLKKKINAPQQFIYDKIIESCLYDIERATGRKLKASVLSGYEYQKAIGGQAKGTVKFDEITSPTTYAFTTETDQGRYHTRWQLTDINDGKTEILITEKAQAKTLLQLLNNGIMWAFMETAKKRALRAMLEKMEQTYHAN